MVNILVDDIPITVPEGTTILEAAKVAGIHIPHLCYLKGINDIGACRVCVVELVGNDRLVPSCNTAVEEGMQVLTNSPRVRETRRINVQLLLSQHDCHCATCVRSGNCVLQDLSNNLNIIDIPYEKKVPPTRWNRIFPLIRQESEMHQVYALHPGLRQDPGPEHLGRGGHRLPGIRQRQPQPDHPGGGLRSVRPVHHPLPHRAPCGSGTTPRKCWPPWRIRRSPPWFRWPRRCGWPGRSSSA